MITLRREPAPLARRNKTELDHQRDRIVVRWSVGAHVGLGEASPLRGWGGDSLELAERELREFDPRWPPSDFYSRLGRLRSPSARFALELAAFDLSAQKAGSSFRDVVSRALGGVEARALEHAVLVDVRDADLPDATTYKIKLGLDLEAELELAARIRAERPDAALRFDANGTLGDEAPRVLAELAELGAELIEEPPLHIDSPIPVALDESLALLSANERRALYHRGVVQAIVLKPMALGGIRTCVELAREAAGYGVWSIVSHLWTGSIARRGERALAEAVDPLVARRRAHGLGWDPSDRSLSVALAAEEHPDDLALIDEHGTLTWREMSALVAAHPQPASSVRVALEPRPDRASVVAILAAIERGNPLVLLHPNASDEQKARRRSRAGVDSSPLPEPAALPVPDEAPLAFAFTSGTSGEPKIAVLSRRAMVAAARASAARLGWRDDDRWLLSLPPAHVGGLSVIARCLLARKPIVLASTESMRDAIERHRVTLVSIVPTILHRWLRDGWKPPRSLRIVLVGGASCPEELREHALRAGFPVATTYGLTETCSQVATRLPDDETAGVGRPLDGVEVRIIDGRIHVRGPSLMDGYLFQPPLDDWLDTGDLGERIGDHLRVQGRAGEMIVSGGENVYPAMVERVLVGGAIESACVFGVPDPEWGEVVAAAVTGDASSVRESLLDAVQRLARHERPKVYAHLETLPRTESGKVDRRALARAAKRRLRPL